VPVPPAELNAYLVIEGPAREAVLAAVRESRLARDAGPGELVLTGPRAEVLDALRDAVEAALDAGARGLEVRLDAPTESRG
jgi:uncharacterized protein YqgV (UPF0045/DUF77 family)